MNEKLMLKKHLKLGLTCVGLWARWGPFWLLVARERTTVTRAAEMAAATIKTAARRESMMSFFLLLADEEEEVGLVRGTVERREEPPGSEGPNFPYSICVGEVGCGKGNNELVAGFSFKW